MQAAGRAGGGETRASDGGDARLARGAFARVNNVRVCHVRALPVEDPTASRDARFLVFLFLRWQGRGARCGQFHQQEKW